MHYERVLGELVGEVILNPPARGGPRALRPTVRAGLELLDLAMHPTYVIRQTEDLAFADALTLRRSVEVEVATDDADVGERGWLPLLALPRPLEVPIDVYDADGRLLPRPRGSEVREALGAALAHLLRELLVSSAAWTAKPDEDPDEERLVDDEDLAQWTLQAAVAAVCLSGPDSPHAAQRRSLLDRSLRGPAAGRPAARPRRRAAPPDIPVADLRRIARGDHRARGDRARALALDHLLDQLAEERGFLQLLDFVYSRSLVIATIEPGLGDRRLRVDLPPVVASDRSRHRQVALGVLRSLKPGDHNLTARINVPVPQRIEQYRLQVSTSTEPDGASDTTLGVVAAIAVEPAPIAGLVATLATCTALVQGEVDALPDDVVGIPAARCRLAVLAHALAEGRAALERLRETAEAAFSGTRDVLSRWDIGGGRSRARRGYPYRDARPQQFRTAVALAAGHLAGAERLARDLDARLARHGPSRRGRRRARAVLPRHRRALAELRAHAGAGLVALDDVRDRAAHLDVHLTCEDTPGATTARVLAPTAPGGRPHDPGEARLDVWAALVDESTRYPVTVFPIPLGMIVLLGAFGFLIFESATWWWPWAHYPVAERAGAGGVLDRQADALAAVMLLIPAFVASQLRLARASSVLGKLRRVPRLQSYTAVLASAACAMFVATAMGAGADAGDVSRVLWVFRAAIAVFILTCVWAGVASARRRSTLWEPKGMQRALVGGRRQVRPPGDGRAGIRERWLAPLLVSCHPDVEFDLAEPARTTPPSRRGRP